MKALALAVVVAGAGCATDRDRVVDLTLGRGHRSALEGHRAMNQLDPMEKRGLVPRFVWALKDDDPYVRYRAVNALSEFDRMALDTVPVLERLLEDDPSAMVRRATPKPLPPHRQPTGPHLVLHQQQELEGNDLHLRYLKFLAATKRTYDPVVDRNDTERSSAARDLWRIAAGEGHVDLHHAMPGLEAALADPSPHVRETAAIALRAIQRDL